jgi:hypothetical protein
MAHDSRSIPESDRGGASAVQSDTNDRDHQADQVELLVLALVLGLGVGAVLLAVVTRKHLFARQISPTDSPIQVM